MDSRRNRYVRTYSFGTDGSAALAGSPISSHRPMATRRRPQKRFVLRLPRIVLIVFAAGMGIFLLNLIGNSLDEQTRLERQIAQQHVLLAEARESISVLDEGLLAASDETRIRTAALNRLGMQVPAERQIFNVPQPQVVQKAEETSARQGGSMSLFRMLLSTIGL